MKHGHKALFTAFLAVLCFALAVRPAHAQVTATTSVYISICGNGIVERGEVCDDGVNNGEYASSATHRNCLPDCSGYGPYCGDGILQPLFGEQCDDGNNISGDG